MNHETADVSQLLDCLSGRLPALRQALLADREAQLDRMELRAGTRLLSKGEVATAVYVIASGLLRATATREDGSELTLSEFGAGELAGEMAILTGGGVYSASVSAAQDSVLVRVPRKTFERITGTSEPVIQEMSEGVRRRIARDQLVLGLTRLFGPLHESVLRYVEARVQWVRLQAGETLFSAGDTGRDLYFILSGRLRALGPGGRVLNEMTRGESIGEIALLTGEPRTATVVAVRDSALVRVSRETFEEIVEKYPRVMQVIAGFVVRRLLAKERASGAPAAGTCIAVLATGSGALTVGFTEKLVKALGEIGLRYTRERVRALNHSGSPRRQDHVAASLDCLARRARVALPVRDLRNRQRRIRLDVAMPAPGG
jgi:CRP-like cAMP-binding protein